MNQHYFIKINRAVVRGQHSKRRKNLKQVL